MTDRSDIVIAGVGLSTPMGASAAATWAGLLEGAAITDHTRALALPFRRADGGRISAEGRLINLGWMVAREAMGEIAWPVDDRTAIVVGTSKGPADDWLLDVSHDRPTSDKPSKHECEDVTSGPDIWSVAKCEDVTFISDNLFIGDNPIAPAQDYGLSSIQSVLATVLGISGPQLTCSAACASSIHALIRAAMLLEHGDADRAIVVGVESSLHPAFIESFKRLGVIANPGQPVRPLDRHRSGFLIAEAAAAVCLERRPARAGEIVLDGYAIGADASHLTGTDVQAVALKRCLAKVFGGRAVDLVHAHATGTVANDPIELAAIESVVSGHAGAPPILYSHKGAIGHSLGASGLIATVLNVLCHRHGQVPGNVNTQTALATRAGLIDRQAVVRPIRRSIAVAAGFGGATGVVGISTVPA